MQNSGASGSNLDDNPFSFTTNLSKLFFNKPSKFDLKF